MAGRRRSPRCGGRTRRTLMAERLLAAHRSGTLQVAIARSSDYYGPGGANSVVGDILFGAAAKGERARWLGRLDVPHSLNYLPDVARALATLGAREEERAILGPDPWCYGLDDANRRNLATFLGYAVAQGIAGEELALEELFHPATVEDPPVHV